jgi:glutathione S-transferase
VTLFFSPGACSLAPHIALFELGLNHKTEKVDIRAKQFSGGDYRQINPKGSVPVVKLDSGELLTEAAVILQFLADQKPSAEMLPIAGTFDRVRAQEWLNYIATEIHKGFSILWGADRLVSDKTGNDQLKNSARENMAVRFNYISEKLGTKPYLLGEKFSVADAYLYTVLRWSGHLGMDLGNWPVLAGYVERVTARPKVQEALTAEGLKFTVKG